MPTTATRRLGRAGALALATATAGVLAAGPALAAPAHGSGTATAAAAAKAKPRAVAPRLLLLGGATTLKLAPATAQALTSLGVAVAPAGAARATSAGIAFPITVGVVDAKSLAGTIDHVGGLDLTAGGKTLGVRDFRIDTRSKVLTARVQGTDTRLPLLKLDLSKAKVTTGKGGRVQVAGVAASLTPQAASAINSFFGVTAFSGGLAIGTADVRTTGFVVKAPLPVPAI